METLAHLDPAMADHNRAVQVDVDQTTILGQHRTHANPVFVRKDVDSPLAQLVLGVEFLDLLFQVVVVASLDHLIETGVHAHVALDHHLPAKV